MRKNGGTKAILVPVVGFVPSPSMLYSRLGESRSMWVAEPADFDPRQRCEVRLLFRTAKMLNSIEDAHQKTTSTFEADEHLRAIAVD